MTEARSGENTKFSKNTGLYRGDISRYAILAGGTKGEKFMIKNVIELLGNQNIDPTDKMNALEQMVQYKTAYHRMRAEEEKKAYTGKIRNFLSSAAAEGTDLSGLDLSEPGHRESGLDLSGISLRGAGMRGARLCGINFSRADFSGADLTGTDFTGADLTGADFTGADLTGCDMSGVKAERTVFRNAVIKGCTLTGADLSRSDMSGLDLSGKDLSGCILNGAVLHGTRLLSTNFSHAALCRTDFSAADLSGAVLDGADAAHAGFERACLRKASLIGADLFAANFSDADMQYARLDAATPACAAFCRADLTGAGFCRADFVRRRRYWYRDTSAASFVGAKLDGTDFKDADVRLVDFSRENMKTAMNLVVPPPPCPESGAFTGYRMCFADPPDEKELGIPVISALYSPTLRRVIAELRIPEDAERTSFGGSLLCRCSKAEVVRFIQIKQADHIRCLVVTMIHRLCPKLIEDGKVYFAETPLYEITYKKGKKEETLFAFSDAEKEKLLKGKDPSKVRIQRSKGLGENDAEMMALFMAPGTRKLTRVTAEDAEEMTKWFSLFMGDEVGPRRDYIEEHGHLYLGDLDVS